VSQLTPDMTKTELILKNLSSDEQHKMNKIFPKIKKNFVETFGAKNKDITENDISEFILDQISNHPFKIAPLDEIIKGIIKKGFYSSDRRTKLSDVVFRHKCYAPKLKAIKSLIYLGNVLIAGLVIDPEFAKNVLKTDLHTTVSDIILIVGYTEKELLVKCTWNLNVIPIIYLDNIKEINVIEVETPEDNCFDEKNKMKF
jgi:hypothetical protein